MEHTVRQEMETLLRTEARLLAIHTRNKLGITQKQMAEILVMSESSCSDITVDYAKISALVTFCNQLELSPIHLRDVVEDFLAEQ